MILFCDTSALVKLYFVEPHAEVMKKLAAEAEAVVACRIAWAEYHAALARRAPPTASPWKQHARPWPGTGRTTW